MTDLIYTISVPFKRKGKDSLKESEFVLALSFDLNWFTPEQAKKVVLEAEKAGLIKREGDIIRPAFDLSSVEPPQGFKPGVLDEEERSIFDRIIERITAETGMDKRKVIALINKKQDELSKLVEIEVSAILIALEHGVALDNLIDEEYKALVNP
ncbi:MAG: DUF2240 family protein [Euryarchaeota archaeon]|nr:DUF2240 family protein [Euryarchaeota archaeon]MBU4220244.1 DUF2240 family protein [Euryarchaeota archaeon]MBU4453995.1 DUF2240 family protein [Euryarchaeota archaeon]